MLLLLVVVVLGVKGGGGGEGGGGMIAYVLWFGKSEGGWRVASYFEAAFSELEDWQLITQPASSKSARMAESAQCAGPSCFLVWRS